MSIGMISMGIYLVIGFMCAYHWYEEDYKSEYDRLVEEGEEVEKGMATLLLQAMVVFWLPILIYKFVKAL
jgi:hypothetical protein